MILIFHIVRIGLIQRYKNYVIFSSTSVNVAQNDTNTGSN